jgi:hypothetical protein
MDAEYFSVCMHAEPVGTTTASMIASLPPDPGVPLYFASLGSPCVGAFLPLFIDAEVPPILAHSSPEPSEASPWWQMKQLLIAVEGDWTSHLPRVRAAMDRFESEAHQEALKAAGGSATDKGVFMRATVDELLALVARLRRDLES